jgi:precorrin-2 dehydrogenase/sirohydrochlorin ferrochelatase
VKCFPINLDIEGKKVLVVGGGQVARRKVKSLASCGARVTVVSPCFCKSLARMKGIHRVTRRYRKADLAGACLVVGATDSQEVNRRISEHAKTVGLPVNIVDQPNLCTFTVPAVVSRGDILIAISTGGGSPALSGRIRRHIEKHFDPAFATHLELLRQMRPLVRSSSLNLSQRSALLKTMASDKMLRILKKKGAAFTGRHLLQMLADSVKAT